MDNLHDLAVDGAGNSYVTGESTGPTGRLGVVTIKYGPTGQQVWLRRYESSTLGGAEQGMALAVANDGVYVSGQQAVVAPGSPGPDILLLKYDLDGTLLWSRTFDGPAADGDFARAIAVDEADQVYILGQSDTPTNMVDLVLLKYASDGTRLWATLYDGPAHGNERGIQLALDAAGNVVATAAVTVGGTVTAVDAAVIKFNPAGAFLWHHFADGNGHIEDSPGGLALDAAGNAYVTASLADDVFSSQWWTAKLAASDGTVVWESTDAQTIPASTAGLVLGAGDEVLVAAYVDDPAPSALVVKKLDAAGNLLWRHVEPGVLAPTLGRRTLALGSDGGVHALGTGSTPTTAQDFRLVSLSSTGALQTSVLFGEIGLATDFPIAVSSSPSGAAIIAGDVHHPGTQFNWDYGLAAVRHGIFADGFESGDTSLWTTVVP